jgi:hypothetical protein
MACYMPNFIINNKLRSICIIVCIILPAYSSMYHVLQKCTNSDKKIF